MTKQEIFDTVAAHLLEQKETCVIRTSSGTDFCAYRGDRGMMCAIGVLVPDNLYEQSMEGGPVYALLEEWPEVCKAIWGRKKMAPYQKKFLSDLQLIHDELNPETWLSALQLFVHCWRLNQNAAMPKGEPDAH